MTQEDTKHPELKEGEVFLINSNSNKYTLINWKTKRHGITAYNIRNEMLDHTYFPVFVQRSELEAAGIKIDGEYNVILHRCSPPESTHKQ